MCAAVAALLEAQDGADADVHMRALMATASRLNVWDGVVCAVRASPSLLVQLAARPENRPALRELLHRSNDLALARTVGLVTRTTGSQGRLSPREREIIDHLRQGKKNSEIARSLFITPGTVKSHMDHIFDKLGVRSRAGVVARYAEIEKAEMDDVASSS
jgi:DNA-binding NarL/FixJ family response regulator